jgi:hypothetical protein
VAYRWKIDPVRFFGSKPDLFETMVRGTISADALSYYRRESQQALDEPRLPSGRGGDLNNCRFRVGNSSQADSFFGKKKSGNNT